MPSVMPSALADKIIAEKIREWELRRKKEKERKDLKDIEVHPFLTISRDFGCGEEEIIPLLEKELGWKVYGRNLLDHLAQRESLSRSFMDTLDEQKQNLIDNWVNFLIRSGSVLQDDYVVKISKMIKVIVAHESAIILGRGANYILADKKEGLHVKLIAPLDVRVKNIMKVRKLDEKEARKLVDQIDEERRTFVQRYFSRDFRECEKFDLTFNTTNVSPEAICKVVLLLLKEKSGKK
ncbi:MAG: cytidylate kinase-like family protein [Nitrospinae bacterium]|nr:cytidylate kinase-like family protein [Nitrospinota bacterium]